MSVRVNLDLPLMNDTDRQLVFQDSVCSTSRLYKEKKKSNYDHWRHKASSTFIHILGAFPLQPSPSTLLTIYLGSEWKLRQKLHIRGRLKMSGWNHRLQHGNVKELNDPYSFGGWSVNEVCLPLGDVHFPNGFG